MMVGRTGWHMPHSSDPEHAEVRQLIAAIPFSSQTSGKKLLDVGCGDGSFTTEYADHLPCDVLGIDPSFGDLQKANNERINTRSRITFVVAMGEVLPFADGEFDVAALTSSF